MQKKILILLNESAGTGKAGNNTYIIAKRFAENGYEPVLYPIIPGTSLVSEDILTEYEGKADIVLCSGGDGTLNHVMNAIMKMKERPCLAYIPSGSTNDFANSLGIPTEAKAALETAITGQRLRYDVAKFNDTYFNYVAAFGAFSAVSYATKQELKNVWGHAAYIISAVGEFSQNIRYSCHMKIEADDFSEEGNYIFGAVCNSTSIGGMSLLENMNIKHDDGKMELLLIQAPQNLSDLQHILMSLGKGSMEDSRITFRQITRARFISDENTAWSVDGEFGGANEETLIEVEEKAMSIMVSGKSN